MSKKWYGSLNNRLEENNYFNGTKDNIQVGTLCTVYHWSDREAYEVVKVIDQKHIFIRELDAKRIDKNGMSDSQNYEYKSNEKNPVVELELTKYGWKKIIRYNKELYEKIINNIGYVLWEKSIVDRVNQGKEVKRSFKINISFGKAEKYYDYSF